MRKNTERNHGEELTEASLRALEDHFDHSLVGRPWHGPRVITLDDVLHPLSVHDDVINEANTFPQGNEVQLVGEEIDVDLGLIQGVCRVQRNRAILRKRTQQIDDDSEVVALRGRGEVPLEGVAEHGLRSLA